jgi:hypothetical protein
MTAITVSVKPLVAGGGNQGDQSFDACMMSDATADGFDT